MRHDITINNIAELNFNAQAGLNDCTIHFGKYYAEVRQGWHKNRHEIEIIYKEDGKDCAIEYASHCSTAKGAQAKVKKFFEKYNH